MKLTSLVQRGEILPMTLPQSFIPPTKAARLGLAPPAVVNSSIVARVPSPIGGKNVSQVIGGHFILQLS